MPLANPRQAIYDREAFYRAIAAPAAEGGEGAAAAAVGGREAESWVQKFQVRTRHAFSSVQARLSLSLFAPACCVSREGISSEANYMPVNFLCEISDQL